MLYRLHDILSSRQFSLGFLISLFKDAARIQSLLATREGKELLTHVLPGYVIGEIFYQESSRTFHSFAAAAGRLGATVMSERGVKVVRKENGKEVTRWELIFSSEEKDAYFEDEVTAWASCYDLLIMRTGEKGLVGRTAEIIKERGLDVPIINAGDGQGEHPTQTLIDIFSLFTSLGLDIEKDWARISDYSIAFVNDCKSRTVRSLAYILGTLFHMPILFIYPPGLEPSSELLFELSDARAEYSLHHTLQSAHVYYVNRIQEEYIEDKSRIDEYQKYFSITKDIADTYGILKIMHPFPRSKKGNEIPILLPHRPETRAISLDDDKRALYFYQMYIGVPLRAALLKYLLNPYLELVTLDRERLERSFRVQCAACGRLESPKLGWCEKPVPYMYTLPHIPLCPMCLQEKEK